MPSVLIIEDDASLRSVIASTFTRIGYQTFAAENGSAGLDLFAAEPCDLVITDVLMPEMDGIEAIISLRATASPPAIIAVSGGGSMCGSEVLQTAKMLGADAVLAKPFSMSGLLKLAAEVLDAPRTRARGSRAA